MSSAIASSMKTKPQKDYTLGEEIFNAVTHGVGVLLAIAAIPLCVVQAVTHGGGLLLAAALIYSITMVVEYLMSTLYHAIAVPAAKRVFKVLDHCGIYLYIAGCYAPYCLGSRSSTIMASALHLRMGRWRLPASLPKRSG